MRHLILAPQTITVIPGHGEANGEVYLFVYHIACHPPTRSNNRSYTAEADGLNHPIQRHVRRIPKRGTITVPDAG